MEKRQPSPGMRPELAQELTETLATLTRLGTTLVNLPITLLSTKEREKAKQLTNDLTNEALRIGGTLPRTISNILEDISTEWQSGKRQREDLGSRLRREQYKLKKQKRVEERNRIT